MASLCAKEKKGGKSKIKKTILDLDNFNLEDDNDNDNTENKEKEKRSFVELQQALSQCQLCELTKFYKIAKNGQHITLTFHQL
jgi:hypothetical protein